MTIYHQLQPKNSLFSKKCVVLFPNSALNHSWSCIKVGYAIHYFTGLKTKLYISQALSVSLKCLLPTLLAFKGRTLNWWCCGLHWMRTLDDNEKLERTVWEVFMCLILSNCFYNESLTPPMKAVNANFEGADNSHSQPFLPLPPLYWL